RASPCCLPWSRRGGVRRHSHVVGMDSSAGALRPRESLPLGTRPMDESGARHPSRTWNGEPSVALFLYGFQLLGSGVALLHRQVERLDQVLELCVGRLLHEPAHELVDLARALALQQSFRRLLVHPDHPVPSPPGDRVPAPARGGSARCSVPAARRSRRSLLLPPARPATPAPATPLLPD